MSSVLAAPQQIPSRVAYFKASGVATAGAAYCRFLTNAPNFAGATGFSSQNGNEVFFSTFTAAVNAIATNGSIANVALADGQLFRDMGKSYTIFVAGTTPYRVAVLTKMQRYGVNGEVSEGVIGSSATSGSTANYLTGYVVTWTANPSSIPCVVSRTGY